MSELTDEMLMAEDAIEAHGQLADALRHSIGANNPPLSPFDAHKANIEDLYAEARNWCDGKPIETQAQADEVSRLLGLIREAEKAAEETRKAEAKPFDDAKAEVQERYNPLIQKDKGKTALAASACKAALAPWLKKLEDEKRAVAEAARLAADAKAREAQEAMRAAQADDLDAREAAERLVQAAKRAEQAASRAENDKASAAGLGRAVTLRSYWSAEIIDLKDACRYFWANDPEAFRALVQQLATAEVQATKRDLPGVKAVEDRRAV